MLRLDEVCISTIYWVMRALIVTPGQKEKKAAADGEDTGEQSQT